MDPLSISAGVAQVVTLAGTLVKGLSRFIVKTIHIRDSIQEVHDEIFTLQVALSEIQKTLKKRPRQLSFERDHHANIHQIIQMCQKSLETLCHELPELKDKAGPVERIRRSLEHSLKEERVVEIIRHICSYKTVLQLSLTTISLGALWETTSSQNQIQAEIRKLTDAIRLSPHLFAGHRRDTLLVHTRSARSEIEKGDIDECTLERVIGDWRETADDVATAVTLNETDRASLDTRSTQNSALSVDTLFLYQDAFDPEPDYKNVQSSEILDYQLKANRDVVRNLLQCGIFVKAATYQQRGIGLMKQLLENQDSHRADDASDDKLMDMKEELADTFLQCDSLEYHNEARTVLEQLISEVVKAEESQVDNNRRARLYHKLGDIHFKQNNVGQATTFLKRALDGRIRIDPRPLELVEETAELLVQVLQQIQVHDEARGLRDWIRQELRHEAVPSPSLTQAAPNNSNMNGLTYAYQWCKDQGTKLLASIIAIRYQE
ncbi:uncharacterized protein F4812DRAFT_21636 [Daldinia caldariorum]|uniref:uncharacterized protein n=1 Tax=Daldinia caldariorum TaxID=326644 RepID=UPI002007ED1C|nr:uncharacterized protein F4812DRAFT_21636 [Daldinia caldariorum]KAI1472690.1 hypothetical protein F4812DRAFT_21636 [Daldinia caldariorum]